MCSNHRRDDNGKARGDSLNGQCSFSSKVGARGRLNETRRDRRRLHSSGFMAKGPVLAKSAEINRELYHCPPAQPISATSSEAEGRKTTWSKLGSWDMVKEEQLIK